jgi:hypothetical protein
MENVNNQQNNQLTNLPSETMDLTRLSKLSLQDMYGLSESMCDYARITTCEAMYLKATLDGHKQVVELFGNMTPTQIKDAINIGIYNLPIDVDPIQFTTLCTTINDLFGPMVSAMTSFHYCVAKLEDTLINRKNTVLIASIILSHAYALFDSVKSYEHWPKTAISEYLGYFEKIVMG